MSSLHEGESRKRQRSEAEDSDVEVKGNGIRDEKHWYADGNLVLRVENSLFRVHKTVRRDYCLYCVAGSIFLLTSS